jgi:WD40 repeat protein
MAMLCSLAELSQDMLCSAADARMKVETILYWCDGLPIALAIYGRTIGDSARRHGQAPSGAVHSFVRRLQRDPSRLIDKSGDDYHALATVLEASLEMASKHSAVNVASGNLSLEKIYAALCVMQKQGWAPVTTLKRLRGHEGVWSVTSSADWARIVSCGRDGVVRAWDRASGAAVGDPLRGHLGWVKSVALSADGSRIVSGGTDGMVRCRSGIRPVISKPLQGHEDWVLSLMTFSNDWSHIASSGSDRTVSIWDATTEAAAGEPLRGHWGRVKSVVVSTDGSHIVSSRTTARCVSGTQLATRRCASRCEATSNG